jgi:hypothetical protein
MPVDPLKFARALEELGVTPLAIYAVRSSPRAQGEILLNELKLTAKSTYRKLALILHPDCTGGDAAKSAKFVLLSQVLKQFEEMAYLPLPPPPPHPVQVSPRMPPTRFVVAFPQSAPHTKPKSAASRGVFVVLMRPWS